MHLHPLRAGLGTLIALAAAAVVLVSLALEYPLYRMLLVLGAAVMTLLTIL